MPVNDNEEGATGAAKFLTSTLGNTLGGVTRTVGNVTGAATRGIGDTVTAATGEAGKPIGGEHCYSFVKNPQQASDGL